MPRTSSSSTRGFDDSAIPNRRQSLVLRRMSSVWRRASGSYGSGVGGGSRTKLRLASRFGVTRMATGTRQFVPPETADTHVVTSVLDAIPTGPRPNTKLLNAGILPMQSAPFISIQHEGPLSMIHGIESAPSSIAGVHSLVYILRGSGSIWHATSAPNSFGGIRLRAGEGALLDGQNGALLGIDPATNSSFEAIRVLIRVGDMRHAPKSHQLMISRALPAYALKDEKTGAELAHVRVLIGSTSPLQSARCVRNTLRSLLTCDGGGVADNAFNVGVYDVRIAPGKEIRIRLRSVRTYIYVRESTVRIGHRVVTKGHLAVLHGCESGHVTITAEIGEDSASCFVFEGEAAVETIYTNGDGLVATSARALRRLERKRKRGGFGKFSNKMKAVMHEFDQDADEEMTPV